MTIEHGRGQGPGMAGVPLPQLERGVRLVLGAIFIAAGSRKLLAPTAFVDSIAGFGLLPDPLVPLAALVLPLVEVAAGVGLIFALPGSLAAIIAMLMLFIAVLGYGIQLGLDIDCGCFGPEEPGPTGKSLKSAVVRDAVMLAAAAFVYWSRGRVRLRAGCGER